MLSAMPGDAPAASLTEDQLDASLAYRSVWLDLVDPSDKERAFAEKACSLRLPSRAEISEIESSSRLVDEAGVLRLSTPMVNRSHDGQVTVAPIGFVLSRERLVTLRFTESIVFDHVAERWRRLPEEGAEAPASGSMQAFLTLLEALVDRIADVLELMGSGMDELSSQVFRVGRVEDQSSRRRDAFLQETLSEIGGRGRHLSQLRDCLLGIGRIVGFVHESAKEWLTPAANRRLDILRRDIASLTDYDVQLGDKIQFLLDATLGFINIEQNNSIKVLTVVSIVGIPPTLIASIYGMNFKTMPELEWHYGYAYGLSLIALSIIVPLLLFWRRGWL